MKRECFIYLCGLMIASLLFGCEEQQPDKGSFSEQVLGSWKSIDEKNPHITDGYTVNVEMTLTFYRTGKIRYFDLVTDISYTSNGSEAVNYAKITTNGTYEVIGDIIVFDPENWTATQPIPLLFLETSILDELNAEMMDKTSNAELSGNILIIDGKRWQRVH